MKKVVFILVAMMACSSAFAQLPNVKKSAWYSSVLAELDDRETIPEVDDTVTLAGIDSTLWIVGEKHTLRRLCDGYEYPGGYVNKEDLTVVGKNHDLYAWIDDWAASINRIQSKYRVILDVEWSINRYGGIKCNVFAINNYNKTIKYITVNYRVYNPVNDPCKINGKTYTSNVKCVGPIASANDASYKFDSPVAYTTNDAFNIKITSVVIQFMDNTTITLTKSTQYTIDEADYIDYYKYLNYRLELTKIQLR